MAPSREAVFSLTATVNEIVPFPFPDAGDNAEIQLIAVEASHAHSGCVVTLKLPRPPPASTLDGEPNETEHFTSVGAEETSEVDPHPPTTTAATTNNSVGIVVRRLHQSGKLILHLTAAFMGGAAGQVLFQHYLSLD